MISEEDYHEVLESEDCTNEEVLSASKTRSPRLEPIHLQESTLENRYSGRISKKTDFESQEQDYFSKVMKNRTKPKNIQGKDFSKMTALKKLHETIDNKGPGSFTAAMKNNLARHREKRLKFKNMMDMPEELPPQVVIPQTPEEPVEKLKIVRVKHVFDPFAQ